MILSRHRHIQEQHRFVHPAISVDARKIETLGKKKNSKLRMTGEPNSLAGFFVILDWRTMNKSTIVYAVISFGVSVVIFICLGKMEPPAPEPVHAYFAMG